MRLLGATMRGPGRHPTRGSQESPGTMPPDDGESVTEDPADGDVTRLYLALIPDAVRLAYLLSGDHALAEDIAHEAFLRVAARRRRLRDPNAVAGYLRRTVVNEVRSRRRSLARRLAREKQADAWRQIGPSAVDQVEQRMDLVEALQRLPLRQRTAIMLRYWMDLSDAQIADTMGCPVGTVKSCLFRGLESLRKEGNHHD
jgi:RNA polymerase sigma-70 factor (sigma-E family)